MTIEFVVEGTPAPAGSKKGFPIRRKDGSIGVAMAPASKRQKPWMAQVREAAFGLVDELITGPLSLTVTLCFARPKSHYGTGRNSDTLKPSAPQDHTTKPDSLKCCRAIEDALTGVIWRDDSQVVSHRIDKQYGKPKAIIEIVEL